MVNMKKNVVTLIPDSHRWKSVVDDGLYVPYFIEDIMANVIAVDVFPR